MTRRPRALLEPLFDAPDDASAWAVYADWLTERGDPRGELIHLQLMVEAARAERARPPAGLFKRYVALMAEHSSWYPELDAGNPQMAIEWRRAAPYLARLDHASTTAAVGDLEVLLRHGEFLSELLSRLTIERDDLGVIPGRIWLDERGRSRVPGLRNLELDAHVRALGRDAPVVELGLEWDRAWPRLESLALRSPALRHAGERLVHPRLRELVVSLRDGFDVAMIEVLGEAELPALERLTVWLGRIPAGREAAAARALDHLIDNATLGPIRELGLDAFTLGPMTLAHLADSRLLLGLERLELAWGTIGDEHLPALRALIEDAPRLETLVLRGNYLSRAAVGELRSRFRGALVGDRCKPDGGTRQIPVFGRYGVADSRCADGAWPFAAS